MWTESKGDYKEKDPVKDCWESNRECVDQGQTSLPCRSESPPKHVDQSQYIASPRSGFINTAD